MAAVAHDPSPTAAVMVSTKRRVTLFTPADIPFSPSQSAQEQPSTDCRRSHDHTILLSLVLRDTLRAAAGDGGSGSTHARHRASRVPQREHVVRRWGWEESGCGSGC